MRQRGIERGGDWADLSFHLERLNLHLRPARVLPWTCNYVGSTARAFRQLGMKERKGKIK